MTSTKPIEKLRISCEFNRQRISGENLIDKPFVWLSVCLSPIEENSKGGRNPNKNPLTSN